jgi:Gas vesicle synthesis protein GvpL/GvpF
VTTYLYCVLAPPRPEVFPTGLTGIAGSPVRPVVSRSDPGLEAWVATTDESSLRVNGRALVEQALLHNEIADAALATGRTPLPARFGSRFVDDEACIANLDRHASELAATLSRVAGAVEMSALVVPIASASRASLSKPPRRNEPSAGRRYLETVRERTRDDERRRAAAETMAARITSVVAALVRGETRSPSTSGGVSISHLVSLDELDRYRRALAGLAPDAGFRIVVAGPRAPYSFVGENPVVVGHDSSSPSRNE